MKKRLTNFERYIDRVEEKTGISFHETLDEEGDIPEYKKSHGRDLEYVVGEITGENGAPNVKVCLAHSFGEAGDEDFMWAVDFPEEPVYQEGLASWKEAAENVVKIVETVNKHYSHVDNTKMAYLYRVGNDMRWKRCSDGEVLNTLDGYVCDGRVINKDFWDYVVESEIKMHMPFGMLYEDIRPRLKEQWKGILWDECPTADGIPDETGYDRV